MKVAAIETLVCDAGWRNYHFVKITTESGVVGWSEFDEGFGSPGVTNVIEQLGRRLIGTRVADHERFFAEAYCLTRPATGGVVSEGIGAIENAMLDAKGKILGVPATSFSAARSATAFRSTGRTARPGASTIRNSSGPPSPILTA
jgi:L-alanine-DL-glutamate epimerase-like enolase superfamily enzyme